MSVFAVPRLTWVRSRQVSLLSSGYSVDYDPRGVHQSMSNLFVYGTLLVPTVLESVAGSMYRSLRATLPGYARFQVKDQVYPGIVARPGKYVDGLLYLTLDEQAMQRLDEFEAEVYERRSVRVQTRAHGLIDACAYVMAPHYEHLLSNYPWDLEKFKRHHLQNYLAKT